MEVHGDDEINLAEDPESVSLTTKNSELIENLRARKVYTKRLFMLLCIWLAAMLLIVSLSAINKVPGTLLSFTLSDSVLITIITTTTANIAAFFLVVTKYLFPEERRKMI